MIRQCYVCALPVPRDDTSGWETLKLVDGSQFRCPRHRVTAPKQLATISQSRKVQLSTLYGKFGK